MEKSIDINALKYFYRFDREIIQSTIDHYSKASDLDDQKDYHVTFDALAEVSSLSGMTTEQAADFMYEDEVSEEDVLLSKMTTALYTAVFDSEPSKKKWSFSEFEDAMTVNPVCKEIVRNSPAYAKKCLDYIARSFAFLNTRITVVDECQSPYEDPSIDTLAQRFRESIEIVLDTDDDEDDASL